MAKQVNYTEDLTNEIIADYDGGNGMSVEDIADKIGKPVASVRAKLVREQVYVPQEKPKAGGAKGPGKKDIIRELSPHIGEEIANGLMGGKKDALIGLRDHFVNND